MNIREMQQQVHQNALEHGWWYEKRNAGELLMLVVTEAAEAMEEYRRFGDFTAPTNAHESDGKPVGFASELADIIIRVGDMAEGLGIDLEAAVIEKMAYNKTRPISAWR